MIMDSLDEYLETVSGYIFDNDKLVTYKWLSKELEVHVNIAKQILWEFWQRYRQEKNFDCTILLMGILHDDGMRVEVVKEKDLLKAKEKYSKILSEHIYSLQKVLPDIQLLGNAENGDIKFSAIKCIENNERNDKEMCKLRGGVMSNDNESTVQEKAQPVFESDKPEKIVSVKEKEIAKKKNADRKGFGHLFGKVANKQKSPTTSSNTEKMEVDLSNHKKQISKDVAESSKKTASKGSLNNFFQPSKDQVKATSPSKKEKSINSIEKKSPKKEIIPVHTNKQKNARGKKRNRSKDTSNAVKKRKRITIQSDSSGAGSSDDEQEETAELPSSPENVPFVRERSASPPRVKHENGKRKVLKIVDKTFEEDGFLVTKKVHVYESCSEDEAEPVEIKKSVTPESHAETKGKKNIKQTTLMNFFKKS